MRYELDSFLPVQRTVEVPWNEFAAVDEVRLVRLDPAVTRVEPSTEIQVARGSQVVDADGERRATMLFDPGTTATLRLPDGSTRTLESFSVRATELTVGEHGPAAMPGSLPPGVAYTYAAEFSLDEALAAGADRVDFHRPVATYVDNFLDLPVGAPVPVGYYDHGLGAWVPDRDGRVVRLLAAGIDTDGDGLADHAARLEAFGIDAAELARIRSLYPTGTTLWRVLLDHFTGIDLNPADSWRNAPEATLPDVDPPPPPPEDPCEEAGCVIAPETGSLGERLDIVGTPFSLDYRSERASQASRSVEIPVTGATISRTLERIDVTIEIAGQTHERTFAPAPNLKTTFEWDGKDAYGRPVSGTRSAKIVVAHHFPVAYSTPWGDFRTLTELLRTFGLVGNRPLKDQETREMTEALTRTWEQRLISPATPTGTVSHWTLSHQHRYDPAGRTLSLGTGETRRADGWTIPPVITTVAGNGAYGFAGDGGPATAAGFTPRSVAIAPDGSFYIADSDGNRIRKVDREGRISTVAGTGQAGFTGDGGPASAARLHYPLDIAVAPDGTLYIADSFNYRVRRVGTDGTIVTIAGRGTRYGGDGGPAMDATFRGVNAVEVGPDGSVYVVDRAEQLTVARTPGGARPASPTTPAATAPR